MEVAESTRETQPNSAAPLWLKKKVRSGSRLTFPLTLYLLSSCLPEVPWRWQFRTDWEGRVREKREGRRQNRRSESGGWIRLLLFSLFLRRDLVLRSLQFRLFTTGVVSFFLGADRRRLVVWWIETSPFSETASAPFFARYRRTLTINSKNGPLPPASSPFSSAPTGVELVVWWVETSPFAKRRLPLLFLPGIGEL